MLHEMISTEKRFLDPWSTLVFDYLQPFPFRKSLYISLRNINSHTREHYLNGKINFTLLRRQMAYSIIKPNFLRSVRMDRAT